MEQGLGELGCDLWQDLQVQALLLMLLAEDRKGVWFLSSQCHVQLGMCETQPKRKIIRFFLLGVP